jgi:predicted alpha/beta hydrolase family esterase
MALLPGMRCEVSVRGPGNSVLDEPEVRYAHCAVGCRHLLVFVHGFNNDRATAAVSYDNFAKDINDRGAPLLPDGVAYFFWPGDYYVPEHRLRAQLVGAARYPLQVQTARTAAARLAAFLTTVMQQSTKLTQVSFVAHSLGSRVVLETIKLLRASPTAQRLSVTCLMAAAVPVAHVNPLGELRDAADAIDHLLVLHSTRDTVLTFAFPAGQSASFAVGIETTPDVRAVGRTGSPWSASHPGAPPRHVRLKAGHGDYWRHPEYHSVVEVCGAFGAPTRPPLPQRAVAERDLPPAGAVPERWIAARRSLF